MSCQAGGGGAVAALSGAEARLTGCSIARATATAGGCLFAEGPGARLSVAGSTLTACLAGGGGAYAALNNSLISVLATTVTFSGASVFGGGGITKWGGHILLVDSVIRGVQSSLGGGCLYVWRQSGLTMRNSSCEGASTTDSGASGGAITGAGPHSDGAAQFLFLLSPSPLAIPAVHPSHPSLFPSLKSPQCSNRPT